MSGPDKIPANYSVVKEHNKMEKGRSDLWGPHTCNWLDTYIHTYIHTFIYICMYIYQKWRGTSGLCLQPWRWRKENYSKVDNHVPEDTTLHSALLIARVNIFKHFTKCLLILVFLACNSVVKIRVLMTVYRFTYQIHVCLNPRNAGFTQSSDFLLW